MKVSHKSNVESTSGLSDAIKSFLNKLSGIFVTIADHIIDDGMKVKDVKENPDGSTTWEILTGSENVFFVNMKPIDKEKSVFNLHFYTEDKEKEYDKELVKKEKINDIITDVCDDWFAASVEGIKNKETGEEFNMSSSRRMRVSLKRVSAGTEDEIRLTGIMANYNACEALDDLNTILSDDALIEQITNEGSVFDVLDEGDGYDVAPCECENCAIDLTTIFNQLLTSAYTLYFNLKTIHWNAKGQNFFELHSASESYEWRVQSQIDALAEMCVEKTGRICNPVEFARAASGVDATNGFTRDDGYTWIQSNIKEFVAALEMYYCNFDHDIQSVFDEWIRSWKIECDYKFNQYFTN